MNTASGVRSGQEAGSRGGGLWARLGVLPLLGVNLFMADMSAGIGPFLGVFLMAKGWESGLIGTVMTIGGIAGMLMSAPAGAMVDATRHKRLYVVIPAVCTIAASTLTLLSQNFWVVAAAQTATAIAGAAIGPAVIGITLGIVGQKGFNAQNGRNQAVNHAGNLLGAALSGWLGWRFGLPAVFILAALFGAATIACALLIPAKAIDHGAARGMKRKAKEEDADPAASGFSVLVRCKPLLVLAGALAFFHLGNGAMLPLYGMAGAAAKGADPAAFVAQTIVVAQATMIIVSLIAMKAAEARGYWLVLLISFAALPARGFLAWYLGSRFGIYPVQILDGIGAGLQSVAVPGLAARMLDGTGRVNVGQGALMTVQAAGAAVSPALGGWLAQSLGFGTAFMILGSFALVSVALWLLFAGLLQPACDSDETDGPRLIAPAPAASPA